MDPQAALYDALSELAEPNPDRDTIAEQLDSLLAWIEAGGFLPYVGRFPAGALIVRRERREIDAPQPLPVKPF